MPEDGPRHVWPSRSASTRGAFSGSSRAEPHHQWRGFGRSRTHSASHPGRCSTRRPRHGAAGPPPTSLGTRASRRRSRNSCGCGIVCRPRAGPSRSRCWASWRANGSTDDGLAARPLELQPKSPAGRPCMRPGASSATRSPRSACISLIADRSTSRSASPVEADSSTHTETEVAARDFASCTSDAHPSRAR